MDKGAHGRRDRLIHEKRHDTYRVREKWPDPTTCTSCGALYTGGRWTWKSSVDSGNTTECPACRRIADRYPAGVVTIGGPFLESHRQEIMGLIHNVESLEKGEHPLERIIGISVEDNDTLVTTTGVHVARRIGDALARAYQGDLLVQYGDGDDTVIVEWRR